MSRLSIITVCLNNKTGLKKTTESLKDQTFSEYEFIIVDGGSTDGSIELIQHYKEHVDNWISEKDKGIYHAMNKGISLAKGEYCMFLNSGDCFAAHNTLNTVFAGNPDEDIIYGNLIVRKGRKEFKREIYPRELTLYHFCVPVNSIHHQASFIKRDLFEKHGLYDENMKIIADWEFFLRTIILNNCKTKYIDEYISVFDTEGISSGGRANENSLKRKILERHFSPEMLNKCETRYHQSKSFRQKIKSQLSSKSMAYKILQSIYKPFAMMKAYITFQQFK